MQPNRARRPFPVATGPRPPLNRPPVELDADQIRAVELHPLPRSGCPVEAVVQAMGRPRECDSMIGQTVERTVTCIAADVDGNPAPQYVGLRTAEREARFGFRSDAIAWARRQLGEGYAPDQPIALACLYHGPTDSPANCWIVRARKEL